MKIAKYVGDLLYNYECVVIPGLGGFLTNEMPAAINPVTNLFRPPFKQVLFNAFLKTNDGLLVNYAAREEGIDYRAAKEQVDNFVLLCDIALKEGKRINFHKIGYLYLNKNEQISFEQDNNINYNSDAFGLSGFVSPAVHRVSAEEKLREIVTHEPARDKRSRNHRKKELRKSVLSEASTIDKDAKHIVASRRKSPYRMQWTFLALLVLAMMVGWGFVNKPAVTNYYRNYSSVFPFFYSTPNAYLIDNLNHVPISKISNSKTGLWIVSLFEKRDNSAHKVIPTSSDGVSNVRKTVENGKRKIKPQPVVAEIKTIEMPKLKKTLNYTLKSDTKIKKQIVKTVSNTESKIMHNSFSGPKATIHIQSYPPGNKHFFIIAGVFKSKTNALNLIHRLRLKGYPAITAGAVHYGLYRVAFGDFDNRKFAEQQLLVIRRKVNPSAWIFEK